MTTIPIPYDTDDFFTSFHYTPWRHYIKPFREIGNIYYIGDDFAGPLLIDTGEGLILIDAGMPQMAAYTIDNIYSLGFSPRDVKIIILTHHHFDHMGAVSLLQTISDAKVILSAADTKTLIQRPELALLGHLESGWPVIRVDREVNDGDVVELGNTRIEILLTPGHTDGSISLCWNVHHEGRDYRAALFGGAGLITLKYDTLMENFGTLDNRKKYFDSLDRLEGLEPIDITLSNHPEFNCTFEKNRRSIENPDAPNPFIDPEEWKTFIQRMRTDLEALIRNDPV